MTPARGVGRGGVVDRDVVYTANTADQTTVGAGVGRERNGVFF